MIVIIDYGMGNLASIANMFKKVGAPAIVSSDPDTIKSAGKLILPGVGAFDAGMRNLAERGLVGLLTEQVVVKRTPLLGICLGMQLLGRCSEEGSLPGLGWIDAESVRFSFDKEHAGLKIPHMGWNTLTLVKSSPILPASETEQRFYFVHSYHVVCRDRQDVCAESEYGFNFTSAVARGNIMGVQFHPEKSHKYGMQLLKNFAERGADA